MITLYTFGPKFGLPDPSPFCMKALVLLKMAGLEYKTAPADLKKAPKGKAPYMDDNGTLIADATFIRFHLEKTRGVDFDKGLSDAERATAWAFEKLVEDHRALLQEISVVRDDARACLEGPVKEVLRAAQELAGKLRKHESQETEMFMDAMYTDLGETD